MSVSFIMILAMASSFASPPFPADAALQLVTHEVGNSGGEIVRIAIDGVDPPADLMTQIQVSLIYAVPQSECTKPDQYVLHKPSGKHATIVSVSDFKRTSATTAMAEYSVNAGPLAGSWATAKFVLLNGKWKLISVQGYMSS